jgi:uncharacterized membrane protein
LQNAKRIKELAKQVIIMRNFRLSKEFIIGSEGALVVLGILFCAAFAVTPSVPLDHPEYVPNAVTGLTTLSGILAAFSGFWLIHIYSTALEQTKKWLSKRIAVIVPLIGLCLLAISGSLSELVYGTLESAMQRASFALLLMVLVDFEICFMTVYKAFGKSDLGV